MGKEGGRERNWRKIERTPFKQITKALTLRLAIPSSIPKAISKGPGEEKGGMEG